ncbi:response regulator transcription factor [Antiquaquibacter oligotrophicus]|nr:response regulator transcription factor [Antiquaquibacter oligotrophicus]
MIRVFLVDDHEIVRRGVADLINAGNDLEVVGEASTVREAKGRIAATRPDVAVLDVQLPDGNGVDLCRDVRSADPTVQCLMLTAFADDEASRTAVLAGAAGYVLKDIRGQGLLDGIRRVARGERLVTAATTKRVVEHATEKAAATTVDLSLREQQVLRLIADGLTNRQIGERLELAEKTVKNYVSGLLAKLGMERRTQAAVYGARQRSDDAR